MSGHVSLEISTGPGDPIKGEERKGRGEKDVGGEGKKGEKRKNGERGNEGEGEKEGEGRKGEGLMASLGP